MNKGKACYKVQVYGFDRFGTKVRRRRILRGGSKAAAERLEFDLKTELANLEKGYQSKTFGEFNKLIFFPFIKENYPTEFPTLSGTIKKHCSGIWNLKLEAINPGDITKILTEAGEQLKSGTVNKIKGYINRSFNHAMSHGLPSNPVDKVRMKKSVEEQYKPTILTKTEMQSLLIAAKRMEPQWYPIYCCAVYFGARAQELWALKRSDVCLEDNTITINKTYSRHLKKVKSTKTGGFRVIALPKKLLPLIHHLMVGPKDGYLLPHPAAFTNGKQANVLKKLCRKIGITEVKFHSFRHYFCTHALANGGGSPGVMSVSGHQHLRSLNTYIHLSSISNRGVCDLIDLDLPSDNQKVVNLFNSKAQ